MRPTQSGYLIHGAELTFAVVAQAARLQHAGQTDAPGGAHELRVRIHSGPARGRNAQAFEELFFLHAVLRGGERLHGRADVRALWQLAQGFDRDVFPVERQHVRFVREQCEQRGIREFAAELWGHLARRRFFRRIQKQEIQPERIARP